MRRELGDPLRDLARGLPMEPATWTRRPRRGFRAEPRLSGNEGGRSSCAESILMKFGRGLILAAFLVMPAVLATAGGARAEEATRAESPTPAPAINGADT